ncbi:MAG: hypothetical protein ACT4NX_06950 [Deltaproteobacteria bacterium]
MTKMIWTLFIQRFLASFAELLLRIVKTRLVVYAVFLVPFLIFIYSLTFVVITAMVLIILLVVVPIAMLSKTKTLAFLSGK